MSLSETFLSVLRTWNAAAPVRRDLSLVAEVYAPAARPGVSGFDPAAAIQCFAGFSGFTFRGQTYRRQAVKWGDVSRSAGTKFNSCSLTLSNLDKYPAEWLLSMPGQTIENCHLVIRLVSRSQSVNLNDTLVLFVGKVEKAVEVSRTDFQLSAKQHLGSIDQEVPPRRYATEDPDHPEDSILSEAFRYLPTSFTVTFREKVARSNVLLALFGFKSKTVTRNQQFSTHSYLDASESVLVPLGRVQVSGKPVASKDKGANIAALYSFGDGLSYGIEAIENVRNNTGGQPQPTGIYRRYGHRAKEGEGGRKQQPTGITVGGADAYPGDNYYSRTAWVALDVAGSKVETDDPAPDISALILGCRVPLPDAAGNYLPTTGSINASFATLTVAHANYRNGDLLFIEQAGETVTDADGSHKVALISRVAAGGGTTTLTLEDLAHNTALATSVRKVGHTDNPTHLARFVITDPYLMALPEEFMDDPVIYQESLFDDEYLEDESHADTVMLPDSETARAGNLYKRFNSTGRANVPFFKRLIGDLTAEPFTEEADYNFFDPLDETTQATPALVKSLRRRYTANVPLTDTQKAVDFLNDVLFPAARLYLVQGSNGKIQIRHKKPVDATILRGTASAGDTEIPVQDVTPWVSDLSGLIVIDAQADQSEARGVTGYRHSTAGNSITLAASGGVSASGGTFSGGDGASTPSAATLTVTSASGTKTVTVDGVAVTYAPQTGDTTGTVGGRLAAAVNANPALREYVRAAWNPADPTHVTLTAKIGFLALDSALEFGHGVAEEIVRVAMSFSDRASTQAHCARANIIEGSFKWPLGSRQSTVNQVILKYRNAADDYKLTELRVPKRSEISGTPTPKEISGAAIDNHHQAVRVANGALTELRDCDFFTSEASDGEALTLSEGSLVAVTHGSGGFVNLLTWVEDLTISPDLKASFTGRRYLSSMFTDDAPARTVPLPTTLAVMDAAPETPSGLALSEHSVTATSSTLHGEFTFAFYRGGQVGRVFLKRDGESAFSDTGVVVVPDEDLNGVFDIPGLPPGTHEVKVRPEAGALVGAATTPESLTTSTSGEIGVETITFSDGSELTSALEGAEARFYNLM